MDNKKVILVCFSLIFILCSCQRTPDSKNVNGVKVEIKSTEAASIESALESGSSDINRSSSLEGVSFSTDAGNILLEVPNVTQPDTIYEGNLTQKFYDKEQMQQVFCPNVTLEQDDYDEFTDCWVEFDHDENDEVDWKQSIKISSGPYYDYWYTYYPLDKKFNSTDVIEVSDTDIASKQEACMHTVQSYLDQLQTNYKIDNITCYGDETEQYFTFELGLNIEGISCFSTNDSGVVISGRAQLSEEGLGSFGISQDFEVKDQQSVNIISASKLTDILEAAIKSKIINPVGEITISNIQLEYEINILDGEYIFYPVWVMEQKVNDTFYTYAAFNALSGELEYYSGM